MQLNMCDFSMLSCIYKNDITKCIWLSFTQFRVQFRVQFSIIKQHAAGVTVGRPITVGSQMVPITGTKETRQPGHFNTTPKNHIRHDGDLKRVFSTSLQADNQAANTKRYLARYIGYQGSTPDNIGTNHSPHQFLIHTGLVTTKYTKINNTTTHSKFCSRNKLRQIPGWIRIFSDDYSISFVIFFTY